MIRFAVFASAVQFPDDSQIHAMILPAADAAAALHENRRQDASAVLEMARPYPLAPILKAKAQLALRRPAEALQAVQQRLNAGHHHRRRNPLSGDVAQRQRKLPVCQCNQIVSTGWDSIPSEPATGPIGFAGPTNRSRKYPHELLASIVRLWTQKRRELHSHLEFKPLIRCSWMSLEG